MVRIIAHRGSSHIFPENSLKAFRQALAEGADALEVDLRASADGRIYCFHDYYLKRLTGHSGYLNRTNSRVIDKLRLGNKETLLHFDQFLEEFAGKTDVILDIKSTGIEEKILQLVNSHGKRTNLTYSSFNQRVLTQIKALSPKARTALILGPIRNVKMKLDFGSSLVYKLQRLGCSAAHLAVRVAKRKTVKKLQSAGISVVVWTVDLEDTAIRLMELEVDGMITNVPERMVKFLNRSAVSNVKQ